MRTVAVSLVRCGVISAFAACVVAAVAADLSDAVAWWRLDHGEAGAAAAEQVLDAQANPLNATAVAGTPEWTSADVPTFGTADGHALKFENEAVGIVAPASPDKLGFVGPLTLFVRLKVYDSARQTYGPNNWIVTRIKAGGYAGASWGVRYAKWGGFVFHVYSGGKAHTVKASPGHYTKIENTWLNMFAVFRPEESISLHFYDMNGNPLASGRERVDFAELDVAPAQRHTCIGGVFESDNTTPRGTFFGEIETVAVWHGLLSDDDLDLIMPYSPAADTHSRSMDPAFFALTPGELTTPHVRWAKPLAGGPVKTLGICTFQNGRELLELEQRLAIELHHVMVLSSSSLGYPPTTGKYNQVRGFYAGDMIRKLKAAMKEDYDLIIVGNVLWKILPERTQQAILDKVRDGTGLLVAFPDAEDNSVWKELTGAVKSSRDYLGILPYEQMSAFTEEGGQTRYTLAQLKSGTFGKGRIALLDWEKHDADKRRSLGAHHHALTNIPLWSPLTRYGWDYEYSMAAVVRACLWAAKRDVSIRVRGIELAKPVLGVDEGTTAVLRVESESAVDAAVEVILRNLRNETCGTWTVPAPLAPGVNQVVLPVPGSEAGTYGLDCIVRCDGSARDFAAAAFEVTSACRIAAVRLDTQLMLPGEPVGVEVVLDGDCRDALLELSAIDANDRLLARSRVAIAETGSGRYSLLPRAGTTASNKLVVKLLLAGRAVQTRSAPYVLDRRAELAQQYLVAVWKNVPSDYLSSLYLDVFRRYGIDIIYNPHFYAYSEELLQQGHESADLGFRTNPVFHAERVERQVLHTGLFAGPDDRDNRVCALLVAFQAGESARFRPASVSIHYDGDVAWGC